MYIQFVVPPLPLPLPHAGINGVLDAYKNALQHVTLWGPTHAAPIINSIAKFAEQADKNPEAQVSNSTCTPVSSSKITVYMSNSTWPNGVGEE